MFLFHPHLISHPCPCSFIQILGNMSSQISGIWGDEEEEEEDNADESEDNGDHSTDEEEEDEEEVENAGCHDRDASDIEIDSGEEDEDDENEGDEDQWDEEDSENDDENESDESESESEEEGGESLTLADKSKMRSIMQVIEFLLKNYGIDVIPTLDVIIRGFQLLAVRMCMMGKANIWKCICLYMCVYCICICAYSIYMSVYCIYIYVYYAHLLFHDCSARIMRTSPYFASIYFAIYCPMRVQPPNHTKILLFSSY